jgi:hypothetical protein
MRVEVEPSINLVSFTDLGSVARPKAGKQKK